MRPDELDRLWDFRDPALSQDRFHAMLADPDLDTRSRVEIFTQIARAQGLQGSFATGHQTLNEAGVMLAPDPAAPSRPRVRCLLERGRLHNSTGHTEQAQSCFLAARDLATSSSADDDAVDAAHMLGIVGSLEDQLAWNRRALVIAELSPDPRTRGWRASIANNLGWTLFESDDLTCALDLFEQALLLREEAGQPEEIQIARWAVAKTLRHLHRKAEALTIQLRLRRELLESGRTDPYVDEEIGECLLLSDQVDEARESFASAYAALAQDQWFVANDSDRFSRLCNLARMLPRIPNDEYLPYMAE